MQHAGNKETRNLYESATNLNPLKSGEKPRASENAYHLHEPDLHLPHLQCLEETTI